MINLEKMGKFLRKNREKLNLSQSELGRKVFVTRQAVSQWELGKNFPDLQSAIALAKLFNVSVGDIYAGEILSSKDKYNSIIEFVIKSEMKRIRKVITMLVISLFVISLLFLSYYFINVYNKISIYTINTIEEPYQINGIITKSVKDVYINFELNKEVDNLCLIYNDTKLNCIKNTNFLVIKESIGYNEQLPELSKISINKFINNLYVEIDNEVKIKLNVVHDYNNNQLIFVEDYESSDYDNKYNLDNEIPIKIKETFNYDKNNGIYNLVLNKDKVEIKYLVKHHSLIVKEEKNGTINYYNYDTQTKKLNEYSEYKNNKQIKILNNNSISTDLLNYFNQEYLNKYVY